jgi:hypothetical protein
VDVSRLRPFELSRRASSFELSFDRFHRCRPVVHASGDRVEQSVFEDDNHNNNNNDQCALREAACHPSAQS